MPQPARRKTMNDPIFQAILALSIDERIALVERIWDSIKADRRDFKLSPDAKDLLDCRIAEMDADPQRGLTIAELKASLHEPSGVLTLAQQAELNRRLAAIDADPSPGSTWEEVKQPERAHRQLLKRLAH
jgi:putative addiction module component (TIGR02574 family)